jgi:hypothetical protein
VARLAFLLFGLALVGFPSCAQAQTDREPKDSCIGSEGRASKRIGSFLISVHAHPDQKEFMDECAATISSADGKTVFQAHDHGTGILSITGRDINGDGEPEAVIEGWSGGAHCCYTYWIVSLGRNRRLIARLYNEEPIQFADLKHDSGIILVTVDGRFDYFDEMCHACSPFSSVYLKLEGDQLKDVSPEFWPRYQKEIDSQRGQLTSKELADFRKEWKKDQPNEQDTFEETRQKVLGIVLAFLYGGKPEEAWKALDEMWPPGDKARMKDLILKTRGTGFVARSQDPSNFEK